MSAGGLFMPLLGLIATHYGPRGALAVLATVPVLAMLLSAFLREPVEGGGVEQGTVEQGAVEQGAVQAGETVQAEEATRASP